MLVCNYCVHKSHGHGDLNTEKFEKVGTVCIPHLSVLSSPPFMCLTAKLSFLHFNNNLLHEFLAKMHRTFYGISKQHFDLYLNRHYNNSIGFSNSFTNIDLRALIQQHSSMLTQVNLPYTGC